MYTHSFSSSAPKRKSDVEHKKQIEKKMKTEKWMVNYFNKFHELFEANVQFKKDILDLKHIISQQKDTINCLKNKNIKNESEEYREQVNRNAKLERKIENLEQQVQCRNQIKFISKQTQTNEMQASVTTTHTQTDDVRALEQESDVTAKSIEVTKTNPPTDRMPARKKKKINSIQTTQLISTQTISEEMPAPGIGISQAQSFPVENTKTNLTCPNLG